MRVIDIINANKAKDRPTVSFEVFPPKTTVNFDNVMKATGEIAKLQPDFMSVTYGAGGGTSDFTVSVAENIKNCGVTPLVHLTCVSSTQADVARQIEKIKNSGMENILALRGDIPDGSPFPENAQFKYASQLIREIKKHGDFCIGGACYPEKHPEAPTFADDIRHIKEKVDAGCDFLTTQMFFDNNILYNYLYKIREAGITIPVVAGIMPVTNAKQTERICKISGNFLPQRFKLITDKFGSCPDSMKQAGIAYATEQIIDLLANGVSCIHIYCMNSPDVARKIKENLSYII
ncbi:MAG: methylenetetrahydrofolate reductase [Clostridia bacterium]|nr:methylenetetrahydrofolate reductase [NAD(P)H] [Clostridia bacterium]